MVWFVVGEVGVGSLSSCPSMPIEGGMEGRREGGRVLGKEEGSTSLSQHYKNLSIKFTFVMLM